MLRTLLGFGLFTAAGVFAAPARSAQDELPDLPSLLEESQQSLRVLNLLSESIPREPLEPSDLVDLVVGRQRTDLDRLTQWVSDSIEWLPYRGALKGPRGILIERRGNSLDQAVLLASTMEFCGMQVRLARGTLDPELASAMHVKLRGWGEDAMEPPPDSETPVPVADVVARLAKIVGQDPEEIRSACDAQRIQSEGYLERVLPMAFRQSRDLRRFLTEAGQRPEPNDAEARTAEVRSLQDHWWVQCSSNGSDWVDHDPILRRCGMTTQLVAAETYDRAEIPVEERHRLILRIVAERLSAEGRVTEVALTHEPEVLDSAGSYLRLRFRPLNHEFGEAHIDSEEPQMQRMIRLANMETEWLPVLTEIDHHGRGEDIHEASIQTDGHLNAAPSLDTKTRKVGDAIASLRDDGVKALDPNSQLSTVWIEYEIHAPGQAIQLIRRSLFDLHGNASRRAGSKEVLKAEPEDVLDRGLALSGQTDILPTACRLSSDFLTRLVLSMHLKNQRLAVAHAQAMNDGESPSPEDLAQSLSVPPLELYLVTSNRFSYGKHQERVHLGSLNLISSHYQAFASERFPETSADADSPVVFAKILDVVANKVGVLASSADTSDAPSDWDVRIDQGVLDTVLEVVSLMDLDGPDLRESANDRVLADNTSLWMNRAQMDQWDVHSRPMAADADLRDGESFVAEALDSGMLAVVPGGMFEGKPRSEWTPECWWRIDPVRGDTLGIGPRGWGQDTMEDLANRAAAIRWAQPIRVHGSNLFCLFANAAARLAVGVVGGAAANAMDVGSTHSAVMAIIGALGLSGGVFNIIQQSCRLLLLR